MSCTQDAQSNLLQSATSCRLDNSWRLALVVHRLLTVQAAAKAMVVSLPNFV